MRIVLLLITLVLSGCAGPVIITNDMMAPVLQYTGFAVHKPDDTRWYINQRSEAANSVLFRTLTDSPTHTVYTLFELRSIPWQPYSYEEFEKFIKEALTSIEDHSRFELVSYIMERYEKQGLWAVSYSILVKDNNPANSDQPLLMTRYGYVTLHPTLNNSVVLAEVSERGFEYELYHECYEAGKKLIQKLELQSSPGKPI